jgi:tetratricopeptide (TPR) repeat protein
MGGRAKREFGSFHGGHILRRMGKKLQWRWIATRSGALVVVGLKVLAGLLSLLALVGPVHAAGLPDAARFSNAIEQGDIAQAREWLDNGLPPDFEGKAIGTGIMIGAWEGNIAMMDLFISRGADINKANSLGEQALQHAAWRGHLPVVRWLVERGARINREGQEWAAIHYAAFAGHADVLNYLLERGADVNARSTNGSTPLMMAAREGKEAIAKTLLAAGARRDIVNEQGEDALRWAMRHNNLSIARSIAGNESFAVAATRPPVSWGPPVRSQAVPDRADSLMAQARRMEAEGRRDEALRLYRAALATIRQVDASRKTTQAPPRVATGMVISARRGKPDAQSASLSFAASAQGAAATEVGAGATAVEGDGADGWLRRAREHEAAGRRKEALEAFRQAAASLRSATAEPGLALSPALAPAANVKSAPPP